MTVPADQTQMSDLGQWGGWREEGEREGGEREEGRVGKRRREGGREGESKSKEVVFSLCINIEKSPCPSLKSTTD